MRNILLNLLGLDNTLTLLAVNRLLLLLQSPQRVQSRDCTEDQPSRPAPVGILLQLLRRLQLLDTDDIDGPDGVEGQVTGVTQLATDGQVAEHGVEWALVVNDGGGGLEVLDELADTHDLSRCAELLLDGVEGFDGGLGTVGAEEVPGVEAGEVLQGTHDLVTTDCVIIVRSMFIIALLDGWILWSLTYRWSRQSASNAPAQGGRQQRLRPFSTFCSV